MMTLTLLLTGCSQKPASVPAETEPAAETTVTASAPGIAYPVTIRVGYSTGQDDPRGVALDQFKREVESQTDGNVPDRDPPLR